MRFKKFSFYSLFPLFSIICLVVIRLIEINYANREEQLLSIYLFFNILFPAFYLFLLAYLIPIFISLNSTIKKKAIINRCLLLIVIVYVIISLYFSFIKKQPDLLPQSIDISLGILGGLVLGLTSASSNK